MTEYDLSNNHVPLKTNPPQIIEYDGQEVYILEKRFQRLHRDSARLLAKSQRYTRYALRIKLVIVIMSLATSYLTAISGINEVLRTYLATVLSLLSAILSGASTIKNFSSEATTLYTGYMEFQQKASSIEPIFHHFKGIIPYSELIESIDTLLVKYEFSMDKTFEEKVANAEKRLVYIYEVMEEQLKYQNKGELPDWYKKKRILETHLNRYTRGTLDKIDEVSISVANVSETASPPIVIDKPWYVRWFKKS